MFRAASRDVRHRTEAHEIEHNRVKLSLWPLRERELCHGGFVPDLRVLRLNSRGNGMQASASVTPGGDSKAAIGEALKQALSGNRLQSISLHDERGDVLWLDEGALGPDEHNLVLDAVSALNAVSEKTVHFVNIGDGRAAAFLPARSPLNDLLGVAMFIADAKFLDAKGAA